MTEGTDGQLSKRSCDKYYPYGKKTWISTSYIKMNSREIKELNVKEQNFKTFRRKYNLPGQSEVKGIC